METFHKKKKFLRKKCRGKDEKIEKRGEVEGGSADQLHHQQKRLTLQVVQRTSKHRKCLDLGPWLTRIPTDLIESDRRNPISSYYGQLETPTDFIESDRRNPISSFYGRLKTPTNSIKHRFYWVRSEGKQQKVPISQEYKTSRSTTEVSF